MRNNSYVKLISKIGRPLKDIIILDNSPNAYYFNPDNGVPISTCVGEKNDNKLLEISPFLKLLSFVDDVRPHIQRYVQENTINLTKAITSLSNKLKNRENNNDYELHKKESESRLSRDKIKFQTENNKIVENNIKSLNLNMENEKENELFKKHNFVNMCIKDKCDDYLQKYISFKKTGSKSKEKEVDELMGEPKTTKNRKLNNKLISNFQNQINKSPKENKQFSPKK